MISGLRQKWDGRLVVMNASVLAYPHFAISAKRST
jgi:hypothetical protein